MTESSPVVSFSSLSKGSRYGSCGVLVPNTELKVIAVDDGRILDRGESGELCVRGPQVGAEGGREGERGRGGGGERERGGGGATERGREKGTMEGGKEEWRFVSGTSAIKIGTYLSEYR